MPAERRVDPTNPPGSKKTYTREQFLEFYGGAYGAKMWKQAGQNGHGPKQPAKQPAKSEPAKKTPFKLVRGKETEYKMLINGELVSTRLTFGVINPSTAEVFAYAPECSKKQLDGAIAAAKAAFPGWAATSVEKRKELMTAAIALLKEEKNHARLREVLVKEQGKPVAMAEVELGMVAQYLQAFVDREYTFDTVLIDNEEEKVTQRRVPLGVVGGITPWNFPVAMATWKFSEALMTGNTMVLKPSPYTPLTSLILGEILKDSFPAGVFNVVCGGDSIGQAITEHPDVAKVSFTGSVRAGKAIQAATSGTLKRITLELGGNDAAICLEDTDVAKVAPQIFQNSMFNTGQVCVAVKRCYVHESKYKEMCDALVAAADGAVKAGMFNDGFAEGAMFGPLNNKMQFDRVKELVRDAKKSGATIATGGKPMEGKKGYFYPPTIITDVKDGVRIVDEEQFGPALPVIPYTDVDKVVAHVNSGRLGLGGSVWSSDVEKAASIASQMDSGTVWVNCHLKGSPDVPFGGAKESGIGAQMGECSVASMTQIRIIRVAKK